MRTYPTCIYCVVDDIYHATANLSEEKRKEVLLRVLKMILEKYDEKQEPSALITEAHRILKNVTNTKDPFYRSKKVSLKAGRNIARRISRELDKLEKREKLRTLIKASAVSNILDIRAIGVGYKNKVEELETQFWSLFKEKLKVDDSKKIVSLLMEGGKDIVYLLDNVGELPIDSMLIKEISQNNNVTVVSRSGPMTSDATLEDVKKFSDIEKFSKVVESGSDTLGIIFEQSNKGVVDLIKKSDTVIGKGQANFYSIYDNTDKIRGTAISLMFTKCSIVSRIFGYEKKIGVACIVKE
ncbi:MAG: damage-control phosphatase ARMT1 family protein [Thermoproteota archaeon]